MPASTRYKALVVATIMAREGVNARPTMPGPERNNSACLSESMRITPNAILSRSLAAVVDHALVIALPGKPSGAVECLDFVRGAIPHAVAVAQGTPTSC